MCRWATSPLYDGNDRCLNVALVQVDNRLNGDGTGLPFGVNDGALGWVIFGMLTLVWINWFIAQRDLVSGSLACRLRMSGQACYSVCRGCVCPHGGYTCETVSALQGDFEDSDSGLKID
jgi:hypothetical protein